MENIKENYEKEEWGGWKIVEEMLNHPDENGLYSTSECYQKLYDFVVAQKEKARQEVLKMVLENLPEEMEEKRSREEIKIYKDVFDDDSLHDIFSVGYNNCLTKIKEIITNLTNKIK